MYFIWSPCHQLQMLQQGKTKLINFTKSDPPFTSEVDLGKNEVEWASWADTEFLNVGQAHTIIFQPETALKQGTFDSFGLSAERTLRFIHVAVAKTFANPLAFTAIFLFTLLHLLQFSSSSSCFYCSFPLHPLAFTAVFLFALLLLLQFSSSPSCIYCSFPLHPPAFTAIFLFTLLLFPLFTLLHLLQFSSSPPCIYWFSS